MFHAGCLVLPGKPVFFRLLAGSHIPTSFDFASLERNLFFFSPPDFPLLPAQDGGGNVQFTKAQKCSAPSLVCSRRVLGPRVLEYANCFAFSAAHVGAGLSCPPLLPSCSYHVQPRRPVCPGRAHCKLPSSLIPIYFSRDFSFSRSVSSFLPSPFPPCGVVETLPSSSRLLRSGARPRAHWAHRWGVPSFTLIFL